MNTKLIRALVWLAAAVVVVYYLAGCDIREQRSTLDQKQRETVVGHDSKDIVTATKITPPAMTIDTFDDKGKKTSTVQVPAQVDDSKSIKTSSGESSNSEASGSSLNEVKLPLSVALFIGGIALIIIAVAIWLLIRLASKSKAFTAGFQWVDEAASNVINSIGNLASTSTNPEVINALNTVKADMERFRAEAAKD